MSMQSQLLRYFTEEKVESALFVGVGVVAIAVSLWLWRTARMEVVMRSFALYKVIELALFAVGVALTYVFRQKELLYAVGVGLVVQSSLMLAADLFAERRGDIYLEQVRALPTGAHAAALLPAAGEAP